MTRKSATTLLILAADPISQPRLRLDKEVRAIQNGLRNSRHKLEVKQHWATHAEDLRRALLDYKPTYVHFCGHGSGEPGIVLEDGLVSAEALAGLFALFSPSVKCVVLNACYSVVQARAISEHIDMVIGMSNRIIDRAALEFAVAFYDAVGSGESPQFAFALGCNAIHLAGIPEYLTPQLITHQILGATEQCIAPSLHDWDGAPSTSLLLGREAEAERLRSWIVDDSCRLVLVTGMGGIGKTDLVTCLARGGNRVVGTSFTLAEGIQKHFDAVVWRSLLNAPPPDELCTDILAALGDRRRGAVPPVNRLIEAILDRLRSLRILIILDNIESVLQPGDPAMHYREGYEAYGILFEQVGKQDHKGCLLLTSREKPRVIADLEGIKRPVRSLALGGIGTSEARDLFAGIGVFAGSDEDWGHVVALYQGNPLALELAARHIEQIFGGSLDAFLRGGRPVFADLQELLEWHLSRLSAEEIEIMYWLAIEREPVTLAALVDDLVSPISREHIASTLQRLQRRLPVEHVFGQQFSLQPVLIEHVTTRLVDQLGSFWFSLRPAAVLRHATEQLVESMHLELGNGKLRLLNAHALVKATAKENVRESQRRLIVAPILERLGHSSNHRDLGDHLLQLLDSWRTEQPDEPGYVAGNIINLLTHLNRELYGLDFTRLRIWQACLDSANLQKVDFSQCEFRNTSFRHSFGIILCLSFSPDGTLIAAGDGNGDVHVLCADTGEPHLRCVGHSDGVTAVAFAPDGRNLASAGFDNTIRLWSAADGHSAAVLLGHDGWVYSLSFSPDGGNLASAGEDGAILLWDVRRTRLVTTVARESGFIAAVAFSPDGQRLAFGGSTKSLTLLELSSLAQRTLPVAHLGRIRCIAYSPDGAILASGAEDGLVNLWRAGEDAPFAGLVGHSATVRSLSFSSSGDVLASASDDHTVRLWKTSTGECLESFDVSVNRVWAVGFSPGGRTLATGSEDCAIRIWSHQTCECVMTLRGYSNKTRALAFAPDGWMLAAGTEDHIVRLWDTRSGEAIQEMLGHPSGVWALAWSRSQRLLASAGEDRAIRLWDLTSKKCKRLLRGHEDWVRCVAFDAEARLLASGAEDGRMLLWDVAGGRCVATLPAGFNRVFAVTFCGGDSLLAGGGSDERILLFSRDGGNSLAELHGHDGWISCVVDCGENLLASCSEDGTIRTWDLERMICLQRIEVGSKVWCGAFCSASRRFVCGSDDGVLSLCDLSAGSFEARVQAHQGAIWNVSVSSDGSSVATAGDDGAVRLWRLPDLAPSSGPTKLQPPRPYEGMNISEARGLTSAQKEALEALGAVDMQPV